MSKASIRFISFLTLAVCTLLSSCQRKTDTSNIIENADSIIDSDPEEALRLLSGIDKKSISNEFDNAYYILVKSQAEDKAYIDSFNDSLINIAIAYFRKTNNDDLLRRSLYAKSRININAEDYCSSIIALIEAEHLFTTDTSHFEKGLIYQTLVDAYTATYNGVLAEDYAHKAHEEYLLAKKYSHANYALLSLATCQCNQYEFEKASRLYQQVVDSALTSTDGLLYCEAIRGQAIALVGENKLIEANKRFALLDSLEYQYSAKDKELSLYVAKKVNGDTSTEYMTYHHIIQEADSTIHSIISSEVTKRINLANSFQQQLLSAQLSKEHIKVVLSLVSLILLIIISSITIIVIRAKKRIAIEKALNVAEELRNVLSKQAHSSHIIETTALEQFKVLDRLMTKYYEHGATSKVASTINKEVVGIINQIKNDPQTINYLINYVDASQNNIYSTITSTLKLSEAEQKLLLYTSLGFSNNSISIFFDNTTPQSIAARKYRLKKKISQQSNI